MAAQPPAKKKPRYTNNAIKIGDEKVNVYATPKLGHALDALTKDMSLWEGVKMEQIMKALYDQGLKDGAKKAFEAIGKGVAAAEKEVPHRNPGRPKGK